MRKFPATALEDLLIGFRSSANDKSPGLQALQQLSISPREVRNLAENEFSHIKRTGELCENSLRP
jgi:hypothetical protein